MATKAGGTNLTCWSIDRFVVTDPYESDNLRDPRPTVWLKLTRIKESLGRDVPVVFFEPVEWLDKNLLTDSKKREFREKLGFTPKSYADIQPYYAKKWKKEGFTNFEIWNEKNLAD